MAGLGFCGCARCRGRNPFEIILDGGVVHTPIAVMLRDVRESVDLLRSLDQSFMLPGALEDVAQIGSVGADELATIIRKGNEEGVGSTTIALRILRAYGGRVLEKGD